MVLIKLTSVILGQYVDSMGKTLLPISKPKRPSEHGREIAYWRNSQNTTKSPNPTGKRTVSGSRSRRICVVSLQRCITRNSRSCGILRSEWRE